MQLGFSSLCCPTWDLETILSQAQKMGYEGIELRGLQGQLDLTLAPELAADPHKTREQFAEKQVQLVCLATSASFHSTNKRAVAENKAIVRAHIELARKLGCPMVRVFPGEEAAGGHYATLARIAGALADLAVFAAQHGVAVVIENQGDFADSRDMWFLIDSVSHPSLKCCWNPCAARSRAEQPTLSIPRLGRKIGLVHVCDAQFDEQGLLESYHPLGEGNVGIARMVELLMGIAYDGYLIVDWPKLWIPELQGPEAVLPKAHAFLRSILDMDRPVLTAYKGDKNAPNLPSRKKPATVGSHG